jgi:hypothetical protein
MPDSIKTTRIALIVAAGLEFATAALFIFIFLAGAVLIGWGTERAGLLGSALLGATGIILALGFTAFGIADLVIAAGIAKGRPWARCERQTSLSKSRVSRKEKAFLRGSRLRRSAAVS